MWVGRCFLLKPPLSLHPPPCVALITYSAVCRLIVAIVMLIRAPSAGNWGENIDQKSAAICLHPPLHLLIFPLSISPLCVLHSLQQSAHLENPQLQNSLSSDTQTHLHTLIKGLLYKGAIKTGKAMFSRRRLFEETSD